MGLQPPVAKIRQKTPKQKKNRHSLLLEANFISSMLFENSSPPAIGFNSYLE
jgi:hypothetical protein